MDPEAAGVETLFAGQTGSRLTQGSAARSHAILRRLLGYTKIVYTIIV